MHLGHMSELGLAELNKRGLLDGYETGKLNPMSIVSSASTIG